jgi:hypothetical protein
VKEGYLKKEVGLYATLESLFKEYFFPMGVPIDGFVDALSARINQGRPDRASIRQQQAVSKDKTNDIHQFLDPSFNRFFNIKSTLMMYYDAGWVSEQIPDSAVKIPFMLYMVRFVYTERITDYLTKKKFLKETELVKRVRARGRRTKRYWKRPLSHSRSLLHNPKTRTK